MSPTVRELVEHKNDRIDHDRVLRDYPWLFARNQDCIVSPDSDGLLCALLMSNFLNWRIRGFYDGKALVAHHSVRPRNCIFLDMEIYRAGVRSAGQHMLLYNRNSPPASWGAFDDCFSINNFRGHDGCHDFRLKYPFGTVHFLLAAVGHTIEIPIERSAIVPLLFTDGTYHNLFSYTENSLDWLRYLRADEAESPLNSIFMRETYTLDALMEGMNEFWRARDEISNVAGERGDRVAITTRGEKDTAPRNLVPDGEYLRFADDARQRAEQFLALLANRTGWKYLPELWDWAGWNVAEFTKGSFSNPERRVNQTTFEEMISQNPLSFAMTGSQNYEYTLETPGNF